MIETAMLQILLTVWISGRPPIIERLPTEYPTTNASCGKAAQALIARAQKGVKMRLLSRATAACVPILTRSA